MAEAPRPLASSDSADRKIVLFVSDMLPIDTQASCVVLHRHLRALEGEGFRICVVARDAPEVSMLPRAWTRILLPSRRWYYPPFRAYPPFRLIRWLLLDREVLPHLDQRQVRCVISLLQSEYLAVYAEWLSRRLRRPLFYFYHDRGELLYHSNDRRRAARLRQQNLALLASPAVRRIWTVCPELTYDDARSAAKFRTVYPLPETLEPIPATPSSSGPPPGPVLAYVGSIYNEVVPLLAMIAGILSEFRGRLLLYSHLEQNARALQTQYPGTVVFEGFFSTKEVCQRVQLHRAAFVIAYPNDPRSMPWCIDCFPSKLTQLVQTGLPGIILAPASTALGKWCTQSKWTMYRSNVSAEDVRSLLLALRDPQSWGIAASDSLRAAREEFNPARIAGIINAEVGAAP